MNVMLLAAGEGTRLRPYTTILPKPAIPFLNVPLAAHALSFLRDVEIEKLIVNTFHLPLKIHELFHNLPHHAQSLHFSDETGAILGSGGGLGKARDYFRGGGDFIMMNADEVILPKESSAIKAALQTHLNQGTIATLLVMDHPGVGTQFGGVWTDANNNVLGFGKNPLQGSVKAWHFVGVQILSEKVFSYIPASGESNILYDALTKAIASGNRVRAFPLECAWFETGNPSDFLEASKKCLSFLNSSEQSFQKDALSTTLKRFASPFKIETGKIIAESAKVASSSHMQGILCVGDKAMIGEKCILENVIVGNNVQVPEGTRASNTFFI